MSRVDCNKIASLVNCKGNSAREQVEDMYKKIGAHLINNAGRLSADVGELCNVIELKIKILPDECVMLEKNIKEYITEE